MSGARLFVDGLSEDELVTVNLLAEQLRKRATRNSLRSAYYDSKRVIRQVGTTIPSQYQNLGLVLGWAAKSVDGLGRRCNLDRMVWADGDLDSLGIRELEDSNYLLSELSQARTDSLIHGVSYLVTTRGDDGEPAALVHAKSALDGTGDWNARSRRLDNFLSVTSRERGNITGFVLYKDGETVSADLNDGKWSVDRSVHSWGVPVDALVYRPRSSRRMGRSRISRPVMGIQDAAVRSLVRMEAHMDIYAIPKMIMLGADSSIFKNTDGSPTDAFDIVMGRWFGIPDDEDAANPRAQVEQFTAESPEPHAKALNVQAKLMARETDLPDADFALAEMSNPTSAESYTASRENLIAEAEGATGDWSAPIRSTVVRALAIQNGETSVPDSWRSIDTKWRSPIYLSKAAEADAGAKLIGSVPWLADTRVGLSKLGLSEQEIDLALAERRQARGNAIAEAIVERRVPDGNGVGVEAGA